jgi:hypothetical protein
MPAARCQRAITGLQKNQRRAEGRMAKDTPDEGEAPIIVGMAEAAMHMYVTAIEALPDHDEDDFRPRVEVILSG